MAYPIYHLPVLLTEVIDLFLLKPNYNVIDCTVGDGGHALEILKHTAPQGRLLGVDLDPAAILRARERFKSKNFQNRIVLVQDNYANIESIVKRYNFKSVQAVLLDLGMSRYQLDQAKEGFSFQRDQYLNMSFSGSTCPAVPEQQYFGRKQSGGITAWEVINQYSKQKLKEIFQKYGEIKRAGVIAHKIDHAKRAGPIDTTSMLVKAIFPAPSWKGLGHAQLSRPQIKLLAKVWQAIRIEVNQELRNLEEALPPITQLLQIGGRVAVISYHSLEDRIVKRFFRAQTQSCICPSELLVCHCQQTARLKIVTKKPLRPGRVEIRRNSRARSAKLRVAEKI